MTASAITFVQFLKLQPSMTNAAYTSTDTDFPTKKLVYTLTTTVLDINVVVSATMTPSKYKLSPLCTLQEYSMLMKVLMVYSSTETVQMLSAVLTVQ